MASQAASWRLRSLEERLSQDLCGGREEREGREGREEG